MVSTGKTRGIPFFPGRPLNRPCLAGQGRGAAGVGITYRVPIRGRNYSVPRSYSQVIADLVEAGHVVAAGHYAYDLGIGRRGKGLSDTEQAEYLRQAMALYTQAGRADEAEIARRQAIVLERSSPEQPKDPEVQELKAEYWEQVAAGADGQQRIDAYKKAAELREKDKEIAKAVDNLLAAIKCAGKQGLTAQEAELNRSISELYVKTRQYNYAAICLERYAARKNGDEAVTGYETAAGYRGKAGEKKEALADQMKAAKLARELRLMEKALELFKTADLLARELDARAEALVISGQITVIGEYLCALGEVDVSIRAAESLAGQRKHGEAANRLYTAGTKIERLLDDPQIDQVEGLRPKLVRLWQLCSQERASSAERGGNGKEFGWAALAYNNLGKHLARLGKQSEAVNAYRLSLEFNLKAEGWDNAEAASLCMLDAEKDRLNKPVLAKEVMQSRVFVQARGAKYLRRLDERLSVRASEADSKYLDRVAGFWRDLAAVIERGGDRGVAKFARERGNFAKKRLREISNGQS